MTNLITAQEAFSAMLAGKQVLARCNVNMYGDPLDEEFLPISGYSADIYKEPNMEYCIQVEMVELAGFKFTKPLALEDVKTDQDLYVMQPTGVIYYYKFDGSDMLANCIISGFAQRDAHNAELQFKAFCKFFSHDYFSIEHTNIQVIDKTNDVEHWKTADEIKVLAENTEETSLDDILGPANGQIPTSNDVEKKTSETKLDDKPKQKRLTKKEKELQGHFDLIIDSIRTSITDTEVLTVVYQLESYGFNQDQLQEIESAKSAKLAELEQIKIEAETQSTALLENAVVQPASTDSPEVETSDDVTPDPDALFSNMLSSIKVATSETEVFTIRRSFRANGSFTDDQLKELEEACEARLTDLALDEFDTQPAPEAKTDVFAGAKQSALNAAANFNQTEYESKLADLIQHAKNAKTPAEANALIRYARNWTPEQTEPLKKAIHARLLQLDKTLIERIREAQSPAILNTFLPDIQALTNAVYAHQCMTAYEQRKLQLTQQS